MIFLDILGIRWYILDPVRWLLLLTQEIGHLLCRALHLRIWRIMEKSWWNNPFESTTYDLICSVFRAILSGLCGKRILYPRCPLDSPLFMQILWFYVKLVANKINIIYQINYIYNIQYVYLSFGETLDVSLSCVIFLCSQKRTHCH